MRVGRARSLGIAWAFAIAFTAAVASPRAAAARQPGVVDVDLVNVDVRNVVRLLADVGHVNVVFGDDVSGPVTLRLAGVPWKRALDVVLAAKGLGVERQGNVLRVASLATLAKERAARVTAHEACIDAAPLETRLIRVSYADPNELAALIRARLSRRGSVSVDERTATILVTDVVGCD